MAATPQPIPIVVLAGQSNAANTALCDAVFAQVASEGGLLVHTAVGGTPLSPGINNASGDWSASPGPGAGELFQSLIAQITALTDPASPAYVPGAYLDRVIWLQGEADSWFADAAADYFNQLRLFHDTLTDRFGTHDLVISALSDTALAHQNRTETQRQNYALIQAAQLALAAADPTVIVVDPDAIAATAGMTPRQMLVWDYVHYNSASGFAGLLGAALADAGQGATQAILSAAASQTAPRHVFGTGQDDRLAVDATGLVQVNGSGGTDTVTLLDRSDGVRVTGPGINEVRIHANGGTALFLDLLSVEGLVLTQGRDVVFMGSTLRFVDTGGGQDRVNGLAGNDTILLGSGQDKADGGLGNDSLFGGDGFDFLSGGQGDDRLDGGTFADTLSGGDGADRIIGGSGADHLKGGRDGDTFVFATQDSTDRITDFQDGVDRIELQGATASSLRLTKIGTATLLQWGDTAVTLDNIAPWQITAADLFFT